MLTRPNIKSFVFFSTIIIALSGCDSSAVVNSIDTLKSKAIDGYIVGAQVFCDGNGNGGTTKAGQLDCPLGTSVARVRGGSDVGFDALAESGGVAFIGEMAAPANLGFVTPLSTLAVSLSSENNEYDPNMWERSVDILATSFGQSGLDLSADAATVMQLVRLNAQVNQVISSFSDNTDDYVIVTDSFSTLLKQQADSGALVSLDDNVSTTMTQLNDQLLQDEPRLHKTDAELQEHIDNVHSINVAVQQSLSPEPVTVATNNNTLGAALTVNRDNSLIAIADYYGNTNNVTLKEFENSNTTDSKYQTTYTGNYINYININHDSFEVNTDLQNRKVSIALSIRATDSGDKRSLNMISNNVYISATGDDQKIINIRIPEDGLLYASGISAQGVATETTVQIKDTNTYKSTQNYFSVSTRTAQRKLEDLGFEDILANRGNFEITVVISDLKINELDNGELKPARQYSINSGQQTVTGSGFRGYVSYERWN